MATTLNEVTLRGTFRNQPTVVKFKRRDREWYMRVRIGGKELPIQVLDYHAKPCWTVALDIIEQLLPSKPRQRRKRLADRPTLRLYA